MDKSKLTNKELEEVTIGEMASDDRSSFEDSGIFEMTRRILEDIEAGHDGQYWLRGT